MDAGNNRRNGGPNHAAVQKYIEKTAGGEQEFQIDLGNTGKSRIVDNVDAQGPIHQIGDMRNRGGYRPSARERAAIEDIRKQVGNDKDIIFHDKRGVGPSLINPDLYPDWKPAPSWQRKW